jgi:integrase
MHALLLVLYGAGVRPREAIHLNWADVDGSNVMLTVRQTKFYKTRLVPFGPQLGRALAQYAACRPKPGGEEAPVFTTRAGARVNQHTLQGHFRTQRSYPDTLRLLLPVDDAKRARRSRRWEEEKARPSEDGR